MWVFNLVSLSVSLSKVGEEQRLRVSDNKVLKKTVGSSKEVTYNYPFYAFFAQSALNEGKMVRSYMFACI
jgi:hypothetical protein